MRNLYMTKTLVTWRGMVCYLSFMYYLATIGHSNILFIHYIVHHYYFYWWPNLNLVNYVDCILIKFYILLYPDTLIICNVRKVVSTCWTLFTQFEYTVASLRPLWGFLYHFLGQEVIQFWAEVDCDMVWSKWSSHVILQRPGIWIRLLVGLS